MITSANFKKLLLLLVLCAGTLSGYAQKEKAEQDLAELRTWVDNQLNKAGDATREERAQLKENFDQLSTKVEKGADMLSESSKQELGELKAKYNQWDAKQQEQATLDLDKEEVRRWDAQLLGTYQNIRSIKGTQMRDAYLTFITNVREKRRNWSLEGWAYAEDVLDRLDDQKSRVNASLSTSDQIKITALQAEFSTLNASKNVKELYEEMK